MWRARIPICHAAAPADSIIQFPRRLVSPQAPAHESECGRIDSAFRARALTAEQCHSVMAESPEILGLYRVGLGLKTGVLGKHKFLTRLQFV